MAVMSDKQFFVVLVIAVAAAGYVIYQGMKVAKVAKDAGETVKDVVTTDLNPANQDNIVNRGFLGIWREITGNPNWTLGGWVYDVTHDDPLKQTTLPISPYVREG